MSESLLESVSEEIARQAAIKEAKKLEEELKKEREGGTTYDPKTKKTYYTNTGREYEEPAQPVGPTDRWIGSPTRGEHLGM
jgi:hypothetical protein